MKWVLAEPDAQAASRLSTEAGLHPLVAALMVNRGIADPAAADSFLSCELSGLSDPRVFADMEKAVGRIRRALAARERIVVYGDYDVDGVSGAALLFLALREMGADAGWYIPDRMAEGYGLKAAALEKIRASGCRLVITVDCGISARPEADLARSLGLDLIITDHHEFTTNQKSEILNPEDNTAEAARPGSIASAAGCALPDAYAVIHPGLLSRDAPGRVRGDVSSLTGAGVAFKLVQALTDAAPDDGRLLRYLDLVTLGTVADVGRITGENRVLVKHGLAALSSRNVRPGVRALKEAAGLDGKTVGVGAVGFALGPRINASGRLENADAAFRLLTTESREEAAGIARTLDSLNRERRSVEEAIREKARSMCRPLDLAKTGALVLASAEWHPGVVGIAASRIAEEFFRPAALIAVRNGVGRGSARSIPGFDLYGGLAACADLLLGFGGHTVAAGFTVAEENIPALRRRLSEVVMERIGRDGFVRTLRIDCAVNLADLTVDLVREIERLAPFGQGNPEPRLGSRGIEVLQARVVGNNHLRLRLRQSGGAPLDAIGFNQAGLLGKKVREGARIAAVFTPRINTWNGRTAVELEIRDVKLENR